jgi:hypothetical protein
LAEELARLDVDLPAVTIEGEVYRQVVRCEETCQRACKNHPVWETKFHPLSF